VTERGYLWNPALGNPASWPIADVLFQPLQQDYLTAWQQCVTADAALVVLSTNNLAASFFSGLAGASERLGVNCTEAPRDSIVSHHYAKTVYYSKQMYYLSRSKAKLDTPD